ncbi:gluconate:H+ symporter [Tatumella saanichensis]|uniref:GntT/GntP/DsdX family permease n=1 Tax=Tatumella saanichensis TaxID=480813 RepID=UPI0004A29C9E|nr:gluconate:H+ symporter [Tatumella saanichensis]
MESSSTVIGFLLLSIFLLVMFIARLKIHASIALILSAIFLGTVTRIPLDKLVSTLEDGIGSTLSFLALIMAFGGILGKMLDDSGGAEQIARTLLNRAGKHNAPWVMAVLGSVVGIPIFSDVGFILMAPLAAVVAKNAGMSRMRVGVPLLISLHAIHCILPPHPAATAVTEILHADIGKVILFGLPIALTCTLIATSYVVFITRKESQGKVKSISVTQQPMTEVRELPGFGITLFTILLPLLLMMSKTIFEAVLPADNVLRSTVEFIGNPFTALLISVLFAYWSLGLSKGSSLNKLGFLTGESYKQIANVMLIIAAGGAFNGVITASGISHTLSVIIGNLPVSPILLAWLLTGLIHLAVGSATVAMLSSSAIVLPLLQSNAALSPVALTIAIGSGGLGFVQFTDSLIWLGKEYLGLSLAGAIKSISAATMIASLVGLSGAMLIQYVL